MRSTARALVILGADLLALVKVPALLLARGGHEGSEKILLLLMGCIFLLRYGVPNYKDPYVCNKIKKPKYTSVKIKRIRVAY